MDDQELNTGADTTTTNEDSFFTTADSGESTTPEADKFLEDALGGEGGGEAGRQGDQPPEAAEPEKKGEGADAADTTGTAGDEGKGTEGADGGADDDQKTLEDFDKIEKPTGDDWARARAAMKRMAEKLKGGGQQAAAPEAGAGGGGDGGAGAEQPAIDPALAFSTLAKVVSGEERQFNRADVEAYIQARLRPWQVKQVIDAARAGRFGEASDEILALANEQLPMVIASDAQNVERERVAGAARAARAQSQSDLVEAFPELKSRDEKNPVYAEVDGACKELEAAIPGFQQIPAAPRLLRDYVRMKRDSARAAALSKENAAQKAEIDRLARLVGKAAKQPAGSGGGEPEKGQTADDWLREQVEKGVFQEV